MKNTTIKICWAFFLFVLIGCGCAYATSHCQTEWEGKSYRSVIFLHEGTAALQAHEENASDNPYIPCNTSSCTTRSSIRLCHPTALNRLPFQNPGGYSQALFFTSAVPVQIPKKSNFSQFIFLAGILLAGRQISIINQSFLC